MTNGRIVLTVFIECDTMQVLNGKDSAMLWQKYIPGRIIDRKGEKFMKKIRKLLLLLMVCFLLLSSCSANANQPIQGDDGSTSNQITEEISGTLMDEKTTDEQTEAAAQGQTTEDSSTLTEEPPIGSDEDPFDVSIMPFYRKVARCTLDNGWVFTFVRDGMKDGDDSEIIKYSFKGINMKYKYAEKYGGVSSEIDLFVGCLLFGYGSEAEQRDCDLIASILSNDKTDEELLALDPNDYTFETIDKEMFFRLMREALTGEPQKEGTDLNYWDKPEYAFLAETEYLDGYKFQVSFLNETGLIDELFIDVLYKTGEDPMEYVQLSDLVASGEATAEQIEAFELIHTIIHDVKENVSYIFNAESYQNKIIDGISFSRLYEFLKDIHDNQYLKYTG